MRYIRILIFLGVLGGLGWTFGGRVWREVRDLRESQRGAEENAPVGYVGTSFRKTYHDRPAQFLTNKDGRKLLYALKEGDKIEYFDVTDAAVEMDSLSGGFGRDSNPSIDYPIFEASDTERALRLRPRQDVYGLGDARSARAYPVELLNRVEVVNDRLGDSALAIVFDRSIGEARVYERKIDGKEFTFGTTGYAHGVEDPVRGKSLLYDRKTQSLWLPDDQMIVCVNGPLKGTKLPAILKPARMAWSAWLSANPGTTVLMGNDRSKPIPSE